MFLCRVSYVNSPSIKYKLISINFQSWIYLEAAWSWEISRQTSTHSQIASHLIARKVRKNEKTEITATFNRVWIQTAKKGLSSRRYVLTFFRISVIHWTSPVLSFHALVCLWALIKKIQVFEKHKITIYFYFCFIG